MDEQRMKIQPKLNHYDMPKGNSSKNLEVSAIRKMIANSNTQESVLKALRAMAGLSISTVLENLTTEFIKGLYMIQPGLTPRNVMNMILTKVGFDFTKVALMILLARMLGESLRWIGKEDFVEEATERFKAHATELGISTIYGKSASKRLIKMNKVEEAFFFLTRSIATSYKDGFGSNFHPSGICSEPAASLSKAVHLILYYETSTQLYIKNRSQRQVIQKSAQDVINQNIIKSRHFLCMSLLAFNESEKISPKSYDPNPHILNKDKLQILESILLAVPACTAATKAQPIMTSLAPAIAEQSAKFASMRNQLIDKSFQYVSIDMEELKADPNFVQDDGSYLKVLPKTPEVDKERARIARLMSGKEEDQVFEEPEYP